MLDIDIQTFLTQYGTFKVTVWSVPPSADFTMSLWLDSKAFGSLLPALRYVASSDVRSDWFVCIHSDRGDKMLSQPALNFLIDNAVPQQA